MPAHCQRQSLRPSSCSGSRLGIISLLTILALIAATSTGFAQYNTAEISGVVRDAQGGVLPGVRVAATHRSSGMKVERTSDGAGRFFLPALPVGEYTLEAELSGFRPFTQQGLTLRVGQKVELPVTMQIGQYQLFVAQACSGLNSLVSLSAISLFYVYVRHQENWRDAFILVLMIVPVAVFANFVRILILILLTYYGGESAAQGFLHNFAGLTMFVTALLTIFALDALIQPLWQRYSHRKLAHG